MAKNYYYIDDSVSEGQSTLHTINNESVSFGIGATTNIETETLTTDNLKVGTEVEVNNGIITANSINISGLTTIGLGTTSNPPYNAQMSFELTSNTNLRIKVRGTDGVLRSANILLS